MGLGGGVWEEGGCFEGSGPVLPQPQGLLFSSPPRPPKLVSSGCPAWYSVSKDTDKRRKAFIYYSALSRVSVPQHITVLPTSIIYFLVQHR